VENATTIEEAVNLITEPTGQPQAETEAVEVEAEAKEVVIDEDIESEEPTLEAESYDDDVDYDDVELDDTEIEAEVPEETNLIPVKVNGKEEMWTLDQLKQSAAGQGYINQRMQEIAQVEKQYQAQAQQLAQQQQQVLRLYQQAQQVGVQPPVPPTTELFDKDPIGYMEQKIKYDEAKQQYDAQVQQVQQLQRQQQAATEQQRMQFLAQQAEVLKQHIPEIADPEKGAAIKADLVKTGTHYGFSEAEIQGVTDARYVRALNDAMKWRRLQDKKRAATRGEPAKTVVKAGAKRRASEGQSAARKKQEQRLRKSGRIEDALSLMLKP
jgi:uncharacterized phage infection (PIP) family protein YhgE